MARLVKGTRVGPEAGAHLGKGRWLEVFGLMLESVYFEGTKTALCVEV